MRKHSCWALPHVFVVDRTGTPALPLALPLALALALTLTLRLRVSRDDPMARPV